MGSLISRILTPTYRRVLILGPNKSGKTSILSILTSIKNQNSYFQFFRRDKNDIPDKKVFSSNISFNYTKFNFQDRYYQIFELSNLIKKYWKCYYQNLDGLIIVLNINDFFYNEFYESQYFIRSLYEEFKHFNEYFKNDKISLPVLFLLNKSDKQNQEIKENFEQKVDKEENEDRKEENEFIKNLRIKKLFSNYKLQKSTILDKFGIIEGFTWLTEKCNK